MEGDDLGRGERARAACGGYICFEDEAGFTRRPLRGRTWGRRGRTPQVTVSGRRSGRLSVAGLIAVRPGSRTRLCHRLNTHVSHAMRELIAEREWLTVFLLPAYSPDLNPSRGYGHTSNAAWPISPP